jgi:hypothetical protein
MKVSAIHTMIVASVCALGLSGCIPDRHYQTKFSVVAVTPEPLTLPDKHPKVGEESDCFEPNGTSIKKLTPAHDAHGKPVPNSSGPCLAFLEFDDQGRKWDPSQLDHATALIRKAIDDDPQHQPVILTFIHGWKHNAKGGHSEDTNIQGVEHVLNYLHRCIYSGHDSSGKDCNGEPVPSTPVPGHVVVGIFIAWRGDSISHYWPVARTVSVYSRAMAANRVGGTELTEALLQISATAHPGSSAGKPSQPVLIIVGHSFGGRVLETAMYTDYTRKLNEREAETKAHQTSLSSGIAEENRQQVATFADLILYVNSAASALSSVRLLDYMAEHKLEYREDDPNPKLPLGNGAGANRPLLLSITTPGDSATGILFPIAFGADGAVKYQEGGLHKQVDVTCFDPDKNPETWTNSSVSQLSMYRSSAAHVDLLQSHELVDLGPPLASDGPPKCQPVTLPNAYVYGVANRCFLIRPKQTLLTGDPRCNATPYWIMNTDADIIPDHSTIFTDRLIGFIGIFLPTSMTTLISSPRLTTSEERETSLPPASQR